MPTKAEARPRRRPLALQVVDTVPGPRPWCGCDECWPAYTDAVWRWSAEADARQPVEDDVPPTLAEALKEMGNVVREAHREE